MKKKKILYLISLIALCIGLVLLVIFYVLNVINKNKIEYFVLDNTEEFSLQKELYYVQKQDSNYKVISKLSGNHIYHIIGYYNNKFYYISQADDEIGIEIRYIDLDDDNKIKSWISIPQPAWCADEDGYRYGCEGVYIGKSKIVGDTLYFNMVSTDGLSSINMDATNFDQHIDIDDQINAYDWYFDDNNKNIYILYNVIDGGGAYKYNISTGKKIMLFDTDHLFDSIKYVNEKLVYYSHDDDTLYVYDIKNKKLTKLYSGFSLTMRVSDGFGEIYTVSDTNIYYYGGEGKIMKYDTEKNKSALFYEMTNYSKYRELNYIGNNETIQITYGLTDNVYVRDGKLTDLDNFDVLMLDGTTKQFNEKQIISKYYYE